MSISKAELIDAIQQNAIHNGYEPINEAGANLVLHELEHTLGHASTRPRTMGALLIWLGKQAFSARAVDVIRHGSS